MDEYCCGAESRAETQEYRQGDVRDSIKSNKPLEGPLHVVACVSNAVGFRRRFELARAFFEDVERLEAAGRPIALYVVELAYAGQDFHVTSEGNPRHLRLRSERSPIWHKESLINCAVRALLPRDWRAMAWIDADITFESPSWAEDALRLLNGRFDVLQLFSHAKDLGPDGAPMNVFSGFGHELLRGRHRAGHPGFAWACTREAYDRVGGLYDFGVIGGGDAVIARSILGQAPEALLPPGVHADCVESLRAWQRGAKGLRLGYVPGVIQHHYHGDKRRRSYSNRHLIIVKHGFSSLLHLERREGDGLLEPSAACPPGLLADVAAYFSSRDEDSIYSEAAAALLRAATGKRLWSP